MAMSLGQILAVLATLGSIVSIGDSHWSYHDIPEWDSSYPNCARTRQSPINIDTSNVEKDDKLVALKFNGYSSKQGSFNVENNGHTVQLNVDEGEWSISGGNLNEDYQLLQLHFHWGTNDSEGSEHAINAASYPLEMHLVHQKLSIVSMDEAKNVSDGLAVVGVLFEIGEENVAYNTLLEAFASVKYKDATMNVTHFAISDLLPDHIDSYYRYMGSLTTPGCDEAVVWTIFLHTVKISSAQLEKFRNLQAGEPGSNEGTIAPNFRPVQHLNGRVIHRTPDHASTAAIAHPAIVMIVFMVVFFFIAKP